MLDGDLELPDWGPLVLAHARTSDRAALEAMLAFDLRLGRIVYGASEPMLGQIRLAWWREEIARERCADAPLPADPLLSAIVEHWGRSTSGLLALLDGWERRLGEAPLGSQTDKAFSEGRSLAFSGFADLAGESAHRQDAGMHGQAWGLAELAMSEGSAADALDPLPRLPRSLRPLSVIGGLSVRAVKRGGRPLLGDRFSPLVALRLGIFGT